MSGFGSGTFGSTPFGAPGDPPPVDVLSEGVGFIALMSGFGMVPLSDGMVFSDENSAVAINVLIDRLNATGSPFEFATKFEGIEEQVALDATMVAVWRMLASEEIDLVGTAVASQRKLAVAIDILHAAGIVATRKDAMVEIAQVIAINTLMRSGWKVDATDSVAFEGALTATLAAMGHVLEGIGFEDSMTQGVRILAIANDGFQIDDELTSFAALFASLREDVLLYTVIRLGADEYVGWVLNEGAPSEYTNFPMNGLAHFGGHYFGTSRDGFFLLEGEDDDGEDIEASFKTALMDFGTGQLKGQVEAYVALSTDATQLVFKVITSDSRGNLLENIYTQPVTPGSLHTERMKIGKGLEGAYWQFELANVDGADFDVDSLDFRPLILNRRV